MFIVNCFGVVARNKKELIDGNCGDWCGFINIGLVCW
jgi:hypothetical protein